MVLIQILHGLDITLQNGIIFVNGIFQHINVTIMVALQFIPLILLLDYTREIAIKKKLLHQCLDLEI